MLKKISNIIRYGYYRLKTKELQDEYINWLGFANAGMANKGNFFAMDYAIQRLPTENPVLEIGSFCGLSTNAISYFLHLYNKKNTIFTSDKWVFEGSEDSANIGKSNIPHIDYRAFVKESFVRNINMFSQDKLPYSIEEFSDDFFRLWSENKKQEDIFGREVVLGGNLSFAYIDGNHSYEFAKRDFENTDKYLDKNGFILFDDSADYYDFGSSKLMQEIRKNKNYRLVMKNPNYLFQKLV